MPKKKKKKLPVKAISAQREMQIGLEQKLKAWASSAFNQKDSKASIPRLSFEKQFPDMVFNASNDQKMGAVLQQLESLSFPPIKENAGPQVFIIIGEGHFASCLPELVKAGVNFILFVDLNPILLANNENLYQWLCNPKNKYENFSQFYPQSPAITSGRVPISISDYEAAYKLIKSADYLESKSFLSSKKRYQSCQAAAQSVTAVTVQMDFTDITKITELQKLITDDCKGNIIGANITNVEDYDNSVFLGEVYKNKAQWKPLGNVLKSLQILFALSAQPLIISSRVQLVVGKPMLISRLDIGLDAFCGYRDKFIENINKETSENKVKDLASMPTLFQGRSKLSQQLKKRSILSQQIDLAYKKVEAKEMPAAIDLFIQAEQLATDLKSNQSLLEIYYGIAKAYSISGRAEDAYVYLVKATEMDEHMQKNGAEPDPCYPGAKAALKAAQQKAAENRAASLGAGP